MYYTIQVNSNIKIEYTIAISFDTSNQAFDKTSATNACVNGLGGVRNSITQDQYNQLLQECVNDLLVLTLIN
jgi:hypothetical protein